MDSSFNNTVQVIKHSKDPAQYIKDLLVELKMSCENCEHSSVSIMNDRLYCRDTFDTKNEKDWCVNFMAED